MRTPKVVWLALALAVGVMVPRTAHAQKDQAMATRGEQLFRLRSCYGCHTFGRHLAGPDLMGVTVRRDTEWLRKFLADPEAMVHQDSTAAKLWEANKGYPIMRINRLNPNEIEALIAYLQRQDATPKKS